MPEKDLSFTVMTYNVHRLTGNDRHTSAARIAEVIETYQPDIVALQELPGARFRPEIGGACQDLAHELALVVRRDVHYHLERERWGNVVFSRFPMRLVRAGGLHPENRYRTMVPRGVMWVEIDLYGQKLQFVNTHLGLTPRERSYQAKVLTGAEWLAHPDCRPPVVLCGDFNALPSWSIHKRLRNALQDEQERLKFGHNQSTFPSSMPIVRFDHIFISPDLAVESELIPRTRLTAVASDHLPLVVKLRLAGVEPQAALVR
ncbi:endonuclease/exonuclease/phosphatase family protein [Geomonas nitrogeniifigens]|uniref:Endonuclease/exonuclease/phosphatase family protein n=1 Tax=Geomonas diazotrophica TaxID=2843197 RepID=A0ABX8JHJ2_9BACT|nr:endonuclease/exonuclease/phosphatase family protein [Geomonas nitrogeniifigens]QWV96977.1 endonuclease/exonuclease/phosphatase family protein [Geomonas nitrogeniifigens]